MRLILILLSALLLISACTPPLNIYRKPINRFKLKQSAFEAVSFITYKNGKSEKIMYTTVTEDSLTVVNIENKNIDPVMKTVSFNDILMLQVFEHKDGSYVIYTFDKP